MKYALLGEKLGHSFSPIIHKEIFKDLKIDADYELLEIKKEDIKATLDLLKKGICLVTGSINIEINEFYLN